MDSGRPRTDGEDHAAQQLAEVMAGNLRDVLREAGVSRNELSQIRGVVSASGTPYVHIGAFRIGSTMQMIAGLSPSAESCAVDLPPGGSAHSGEAVGRRRRRRR